MIIVRNLRMEPGEGAPALKKRAAAKLRVDEGEIKELRMVKRSLDARRKSEVHYVVSAVMKVSCESRVLARAKSADAAEYKEYHYDIPRAASDKRPVIAGFGPAGMFAALVLAKAGARPIVLERGADVDTRVKKVEAFRNGSAPLDPECSVQFGEGGAGTFSDGKLNTGIHDERLEWMLRRFYEHGAPEEILYDAKPHIGTDILVDVVRNIRLDIEKHGGEVRFGHRLEKLVTEENRLVGALVSGPRGGYTLPCESLILAVGHSARDTFEMLHALGVPMEPKAFSMGVRI